MRREDVRRALAAPPLPEPERQWSRVRARLRSGAGATHVSLPLALAAAAAALVLGVGTGVYRQFAAPTQWLADGASVALDTTWLETADDSLRLNVGRIGHVTLAPGARARLRRGAWNEHRLALARGSMEAVIAAPPRLFFVETPTALATDLGCAYRLEVAADGATTLHVSVGWVELAKDGRRSVVPAGLTARVDANGVPGVPYDPALPADAIAALDRVLHAGDASPDAADLALILAALDSADRRAPANIRRQTSGITLWHLLQRVKGQGREAVTVALEQRAARPAAVTREGILTLDRQMLDRWRRSLHPMWGETDGPLWVVAAQRIWLWVMD
ncbi:MAG: hypothetical protein C0503_09350 [Gemmatimonas sp.]|nr:hypothetical protein [Gemmatimonas sp.]